MSGWSVVALCSVVAVRSVVAADIHALRMEIVQTTRGLETVLRDSVSIVDGETTISCGQARINESLGRAVVSGDVVIHSPGAVVLADSAVYMTQERRADLYGDVRVEQESLMILAPRLHYSIAERLVEVDTALVVESVASGFRLTGAQGHYDLAARTGTVDVWPRLVRRSGGDSVTVTARLVTWFEHRQEALAAGEVIVRARTARLDCDTLRFYPELDSGFAIGHPAVEDSLSTTAGDTVALSLVGGQLRALTVCGNAAGRYDTGAGERVEVEGSVIRIGFESGVLDRIEVELLRKGRLVRSAPTTDGG